MVFIRDSETCGGKEFVNRLFTLVPLILVLITQLFLNDGKLLFGYEFLDEALDSTRDGNLDPILRELGKLGMNGGDGVTPANDKDPFMPDGGIQRKVKETSSGSNTAEGNDSALNLRPSESPVTINACKVSEFALVLITTDTIVEDRLTS